MQIAPVADGGGKFAPARESLCRVGRRIQRVCAHRKKRSLSKIFSRRARTLRFLRREGEREQEDLRSGGGTRASPCVFQTRRRTRGSRGGGVEREQRSERRELAPPRLPSRVA